MPLVDRGVEMLSKDDLHKYLGLILAPLEIIVALIFPMLWHYARKYEIYLKFPANLFLWVIQIDWLYAIFMGPLRWFEFNPFYADVATPTTTSGCRFAVFIDTFCQIGLVFTNTCIVACAFYMVYFKANISPENQKKYSFWLKVIFFMICMIVCILTIVGDISNYVGWCTANSTAVIFKQLVWFLALVIQITMIIPTNYIIWESGKKSKKAISTGFYIRFIGIVFTQIIGLFPVMGVEFLGLARKPIPSSMMWCVIGLFPLAHLCDFAFLSMKVWPHVVAEKSKMKYIFMCCIILSQIVEDEGNNAKSKSKSKKKKKDDEDDEAAKKKKKANEKSGSFFDRVPFWLHLILTLAIPFLLLCAVSVVMLLDKQKLVDKADDIQADIELTTLISNYIHETQKERGATGVFMGSKGTKFKCEITSQYVVTNEQKVHLEVYLSNDFRNVKLVTKLTFLHSLIYMLNIEDHRKEVQEFNVPKAKGVSWYSDHNMFFVGIVALVCRDSHLDEDTITHYIYANLAFVSAKEKAGVERAKGSVAFAANGWSSTDAYRTFVELVAAQDNHLYFFETYVADENLQLYKDTLRERVTVVSNQMREIGLEADSDVMSQYEGGDWFNNMTGKINLIRQVEATLAQQLTTKSLDVVQSTTSAMMFVVFTLAFVLIIDGLMILGLARTSDHLKRFQIGQGESNSKKKRSLNILQQIKQTIMNLSFVYEVLIPVVLCGLGLVVVSYLLLKGQVADSQLAASTWENMNLSFFMSNFIHETQKERGASGVYMGSGGAKFSVQLHDQTKLCDSKRAPLFQFLTEEYIDFDSLQEHPKMVFWVEESKRLRDMRINVRYLNITSAQGLGYYTTMNAHIVGTVSEMAFRGSSKTVEARLLAYLGFMYMKEKAGNERAVGTLGMGTGFWPTRLDWRKFIQLVAIQKNAFLYFEQFGTKVSKDKFAEVSVSRANQILNVWQKAGLENDSTVMGPVDSSQWFGNCTIKIDEWRIVENMIAFELGTFFNGLEDETNSFVIFILTMLIFLFIFTTAIGIKGIRLLLRSNAYNLYQDKVRDEKRRARKKKRQAEKAKQQSS